MKKKTKEKDYTIMWHNMITGKSVREILKQVEDITKDLKSLYELEKAKKITLECRDEWPSISGITIINNEDDEKVIKEVEKNRLVCVYEFEDDEREAE